VGKEIDELTKNFPEYNTILRFLRERSMAMPVTIATGSLGGTPAEYAEALKTVYEQAHDTEYLLFFTLIFRYLPYENVCTLSEQIHDVKWLVIETINKSVSFDK
jgi:hypothetical protein